MQPSGGADGGHRGARRIDAFGIPVAADAPVEGQRLPLVLMSHGTGGAYASHADTAIALAKAGFVAAALPHTGDNWRDHSRAMQIWDRPRQLKVLADYMLGAWPEHARLDPDPVGAFGLSAGGFTVLVAAGGAPDLKATRPHCLAHPEAFECRLLTHATTDAPSHIDYIHDPRIRAMVSAAPALGYTFGREGLAAVRQPVQLWRAADDRELPAPFYADAVRQDLPQPPEFHDVPGAGHFDFLAPCTPQIARAAPKICTSAQGFDRAAFHVEFNRQVVSFFTAHLTTAP